MAKQAVGAIERHVEKGVLGVTVLLLLGAAGVYLVSSPNTAEIGRQETAPGQVNERVRDAARTLRNRLQSARPEVDSVSDPLPGLQAGDGSVLAAANLPGTWPAPVPMMPRVPDIGNIVIEGQMELAEVIAPGQPRCKAGRSVVTLYPPVTMGREEEALEEEDYYYDQTTNWVTVAAAFDRREQERQCQLAGYKLGRRRAYLVGSELQRRRQQPDGTWPEDWENVYTYAPAIPAEGAQPGNPRPGAGVLQPDQGVPARHHPAPVPGGRPGGRLVPAGNARPALLRRPGCRVRRGARHPHR